MYIVAAIGATATIVAAFLGLPSGPSGDIYTVRVTVVRNGDVVHDSEVTSDLGGEPKAVDGGWEFDIPRQSVSPEAILTVIARSAGGAYRGEAMVELGDDLRVPIRIELSKPGGSEIGGVVQDKDGRALAGARVTAIEANTTDSTSEEGLFRLPLERLNDEEPVQLSVEHPEYKPLRRFFHAGDRSVVLQLER